jgi:hypothetical protein
MIKAMIKAMVNDHKKGWVAANVHQRLPGGWRGRMYEVDGSKDHPSSIRN